MIEKLQEQFNELDPEHPQMIIFQDKINEIIDEVNNLLPCKHDFRQENSMNVCSKCHVIGVL